MEYDNCQYCVYVKTFTIHVKQSTEQVKLVDSTAVQVKSFKCIDVFRTVADDMLGENTVATKAIYNEVLGFSPQQTLI